MYIPSVYSKCIFEFAHRRGSKDWDVLRSFLTSSPSYLWLYLMVQLIVRPLKDMLDRRWQSYIVCLLTNFITAHKYAQKTAPHYLENTEYTDTPERALVIKESEDSVTEALEMYNSFGKDVLEQHVSEQVQMMLQHVEDDTIQQLKEEGIVYQTEVEALVAETEKQNECFVRGFRIRDDFSHT